MRIEQEGEKFVIVRGGWHRESKFCFFVDHDSSCWTSRNTSDVRKFPTRERSQEDLDELKRRAKLRKGR